MRCFTKCGFQQRLCATYALVSLSLVFGTPTLAQSSDKDIIELETTTIKGNTELPKYMYVVPWQDSKTREGGEQKLVLHNLYADLFDPVMPGYHEPIKRDPILHSGTPTQKP